MTGQELLMRWKSFVSRYCGVSEGQALVLALWAMHTWLYEKFGSTPYLEVYGATKGCGKTRVLETLGLLVRGPEQMATTRIAPIVRLISEHQNACTLLIDEAEKLSLGHINETRSALASGYRRGSSHPVTTAQGVVRFSTYAPKAFALIGNLQSVLRDRSIPIFLKRQPPSADLQKEYAKAKETADELKADMLRFGQATGVFRTITTDIPEWLYGRDAEIWAALWSIAQVLKLHKDTIEQLQMASVDMVALKELPPLPNHSAKAEDGQADEDAAERLLADVRRVLRDGERAVSTEDLLTRLKGRELPTAPWRSWRGVGLDALSMAGLLGRFGLGPENIQIGKGRKDRRIVKGWKVDAIRKVQV